MEPLSEPVNCGDQETICRPPAETNDISGSMVK